MMVSSAWDSVYRQMVRMRETIGGEFLARISRRAPDPVVNSPEADLSEAEREAAVEEAKRRRRGLHLR